jgi:hypothetical protein
MRLETNWELNGGLQAGRPREALANQCRARPIGPDMASESV